MIPHRFPDPRRLHESIHVPVDVSGIGDLLPIYRWMQGFELRRHLARRLGHDFQAANDPVKQLSVRFERLEIQTGDEALNGFDIVLDIAEGRCLVVKRL